MRKRRMGMLTCSKCGKAFTPGAAGWMARWEGPSTGIRPESSLKNIVLCPEDYARLKPAQKGMWHEYIDPPKQGPTREKRPGHLGA
jgi:hypothetical protein